MTRLRIQFRDSTAGDLPYVLDSWRLGWRLSDDNRRLSGQVYNAVFDDVVRRGVLEQRDTEILIGCSEVVPDWIWSWLCYTPGAVPVVHFANVRPRITVAGERIDLRRIGLLARMLAAAGVRDEVVYTFRPAERSNETSKRVLDTERGLLDAAAANGITAVYRPVVEQFLRPRRNRRAA